MAWLLYIFQIVSSYIYQRETYGLQKIAYGLIIQGHVFKLVIKVLLFVPQSYEITFTLGNQFL